MTRFPSWKFGIGSSSFIDTLAYISFTDYRTGILPGNKQYFLLFGRTLRKYTLATNSSKRFLREGLPQRGPSLWFFMGMKAVAGVIVHTLSWVSIPYWGRASGKWKEKTPGLEWNAISMDIRTRTDFSLQAFGRKITQTCSGKPGVPSWIMSLKMLVHFGRKALSTSMVSSTGVLSWVFAEIGPFLHKSANFSRSFNNIQKRVVVKNPPAGICHLCRAGQPDIAFEQLETRRPDWLGTEFTQDPYVERPPFVDHLLYEPGKDAALWNFDWFHTMHLGVLRNFLGSVLALLSQEEDHGAIDDRFAALTEDYKTWCHQNSRRAYVSKLSKEAIGWDTTNQFPSGTWHKGGLTTVLMEYLEARFARQSFPHEPLLSLAAEACDAIQRLGRLLYRSSLWLEPERCKYCAELGLKFLRRYSQMATLAKSQGRHLFSLQPKIHVLHHFVLQLWDAHVREVKMLNILATSCQPSEDFIGRPSRLSRRVTSQSPVLHRIMQRYLQSVYHHFIQAGFLVRSRGWRS